MEGNESTLSTKFLWAIKNEEKVLAEQVEEKRKIIEKIKKHYSEIEFGFVWYIFYKSIQCSYFNTTKKKKKKH